MSIDRSELVTLLLDTLKGTHVLAVPLADQILELAGETPPVPALPTEPGSLIRVTWNNETTAKLWPRLLVLGLTHYWAWDPVGREGFIDIRDLPKWITGWEPVSEPRAVTAKAVRERLLSVPQSQRDADFVDRVVREFGVTS